MDDPDVLVFLVPILVTLIIVVGVVVNNMLRMRHGYPPETGGIEKGKTEREALVAENLRLTGELETLRDRVHVLERIATDPAERTAREIEQLR